MKNFLLLIYSLTLLTCCTSIEEGDIEGKWVVNSFHYQNKPLKTTSAGIDFHPLGYEDKGNFIFTKKDSACNLPGINSEGLIVKWKIINDSLIIEEDKNYMSDMLFGSIRHLQSTLFDTSSINQPKYEALKDSIEKHKHNNPYLKDLKIYSGKYKITINKDNNFRIILTSQDSRIELLNHDKLISRRIDEILH